MCQYWQQHNRRESALEVELATSGASSGHAELFHKKGNGCPLWIERIPLHLGARHALQFHAWFEAFTMLVVMVSACISEAIAGNADMLCSTRSCHPFLKNSSFLLSTYPECLTVQLCCACSCDCTVSAQL
uniref:Uncharacterized protein n=1 Tax=Rhipicephalus appendiculatus TaxID=34631 RepID=A0A131YA70_RHIAP